MRLHVHHKSQWTSMGEKPGFRGAKPSTKRLAHSTAKCAPYRRQLIFRTLIREVLRKKRNQKAIYNFMHRAIMKSCKQQHSGHKIIKFDKFSAHFSLMLSYLNFTTKVTCPSTQCLATWFPKFCTPLFSVCDIFPADYNRLRKLKKQQYPDILLHVLEK